MSTAKTRTLLGIKQGNDERKLVIWDTDQITVGRSPENDIVLQHDEASREHAVFRRGVADYFITDLRTANGTQVNGEPLDGEHTLQNKDVVTMGDLTVTFIRTQKDPEALGVEVQFASELKDFGDPNMSSNPDATTVALSDMDLGDVDADFEISTVEEFQPPTPRDLDLELQDMAPSPEQTSPTAQMASPPRVKGRSLSVNIEFEGLTPDLQRTIEGLFGKEIVLPALRIRISEEDY